MAKRINKNSEKKPKAGSKNSTKKKTTSKKKITTKAVRKRKSSGIIKKPVSLPKNTTIDIGPKPPFYIVGIGTSAGGLEALEAFFDHCPENTGIAYVIVQHLSPDYKSLMTELLSRHTNMEVNEARDGVVVEPNHIYLIPGNKNLTISNGKLVLSKRPSGGQMNFSIDIFFNSLAKEQKDKSIGIILSGTGSDGTRGGKSIKEVGGTVFVQSPESSKFDGMPRSAINNGLADYILTPRQMPHELVQFVSFTHYESVFETENQQEGTMNSIERVLKVVKTYTGYDFFSYKRPTLLRRTAKRMNITKSETFEDYVDYLHDNPHEKFILADEFLIGVTKFFRDTDAFKIIEKKVIPNIIDSKKSKIQSIKVWTVACSTGEEAYSLAILIEEYLAKKKLNLKYKIFATDIDSKAIDIAAKGYYSESIATDVSQERLSKYFLRKDNKFQILPSIRKNIIFSKHDILQHPPFNKMDLVSCRNMLIYLESDVQAKVMASLHYALNMEGYLFMGSSENIGLLSKSFTELSNKWKIYQNLSPTKVVNISEKGTWQIENHALKLSRSSRSMTSSIEEKVNKFTNQTLMKEMDAVTVCVDENFDILHASGKFKKYIVMPEEGYSKNILKILPDDINIPITTGIRKLVKENSESITKNITILEEEELKHIRIIIRVINIGPVNFKSYLITLIEIASRDLTSDELSSSIPISIVQSDDVKDLKEALNETRENLQATIEELETSNEEMQATNEELLASNEELQSTNEELQSLNEELHTVNAELLEKNVQLVELNEDIENLMVNTNIGTIFLDRDFNIRKFTPAIKEHFELRDDDVGRPINHFSGSLGGRDLVAHARKVLIELEPFRWEFQNSEGVWFLLQIYPYKTYLGSVEGVIVNFININDLKIADKEKNELNEYLSMLTKSSPDIIYVYDLKNKRSSFASKYLWELAGYDKSDIEKRIGFEGYKKTNIIHPEDAPKLEKHHQRMSKVSDGEIYSCEFRLIHKKTKKSIWMITTDKVHERDTKGKPINLLGVAKNITSMKEMAEQLEISNERTELAIKSSGAGVWEWSDITQVSGWWSPQFYKLLGYSLRNTDASYAMLLNLIHEDHIESFQEELEQHIVAKKPFDVRVLLKTKKKGFRWFRINAQAQRNKKGDVQKIVGIIIDIDDSVKLKGEVEAHQALLKAVYNNDLTGIVLCDYKGVIVDASEGVKQLLGYAPSELLNKDFTKFANQNKKGTDSFDWKSLKSGKLSFLQVDREFITKAKETVWANVAITKIFINNKNHFLCVMIDINHRKLAEEKMNAINEELSRFVYLASHDLKEPLRTITSITERFKDKYINKLDKKAIQYIEFIETASDSMQTLTRELLTYSELGNKIEKFYSVNINKITKELINVDLQLMIIENRATIEIEKMPKINGDPSQIKTLFQNLITNGIKYRKKTAPKIKISCVDKKDHWQFAIKDNGIGIAPEDQDKVFEVFRRLHSKNEFEGSGIGLANAKRIVNNHKGKIWIRSTIGRGSTFFFTIPKKNKKSE